jgi:hypothetical protein
VNYLRRLRSQGADAFGVAATTFSDNRIGSGGAAGFGADAPP